MGSTVVLMYHEGTEDASEEKCSFLSKQNEILTPFKLAVFLGYYSSGY